MIDSHSFNGVRSCPNTGRPVVFLTLEMRGGVLACALLLSSAVQAHNSTDDDTVANLAAVKVTANKVEQNVLDVPASISVIDAALLEEKGIQSVQQLLHEIPNVHSEESFGHGTHVNIRGINNSTYTNNNPVVIYIDGIAYSSAYGFNASLANVERVEVLRGAQGALYGKDAIGGVVNIVTRKPDNALALRAAAEYGNDNARFGSFNVSSAIQENTLWWGVNGQFSGEDGWVENSWPGMKRKADPQRAHRVNGFVLYEPHAQFSARLSVSKEATQRHWYPIVKVPPGTPLANFSRADAKKAEFDVDTGESSTTDSVALALGWTLGAVKLEAVTAYRDYWQHGVYDSGFDASPEYMGLTQFDRNTNKTLSQELRASSTNTEGMRWVAGLYLENEEVAQKPYGMEFPNFDPNTGAFLGGGIAMNAESVTDARTRALFGQVMLPFANRWEATLGGRWQRIEKTIDLDSWMVPAGGDLRAGPPAYSMDARKRWTTFLPKAALNWYFAPQWTAHVSYAKGYMPGGFNFFAFSGAPEEHLFRPQTSSTVELGIKGNAGDMNLAANIFHMDMKDLHLYQVDGSIYTVTNAPKARSYGAEMEAAWRPQGSYWELSSALGIINAKYKEGDAIFGGRHIQDTPKHSLRLGAAWLHPSGYYARLDTRTLGRMWFYDSSAADFVPYAGATVLDVRMGWRKGAWEVFGAVRNASDRARITAFKGSYAVFNAPRRYSVGVRYAF